MASPSDATPESALYEKGKTEWLNHRYVTAANLLSSFRSNSNNRTAELDYMIGTSACRTAGERPSGLSYLDWALAHYHLDQPSRDMIARERGYCARPGPMPQVNTRAATTILRVTAGSWADGKSGEEFESNEPASIYSARPFDPNRRIAWKSRLVKVGNRAQLEATLGRQLPLKSRLYVTSRFGFVVSSDIKDSDLDGLAKRLNFYINFLNARYEITPSEYYYVIYLVSDDTYLRRIARDIHNLDVDKATVGYSFGPDHSIVAWYENGEYGTILHELFHLSAERTFGDIPEWLDEGMAALYEQCDEREAERGNFVGVLNWSTNELRSDWSERPPLNSIVIAQQPNERRDPSGLGTDEDQASARLVFASERTFALYLQDTGVLQRVYMRMRSLVPKAGAGPNAQSIAVLEAEAGPLAQLQKKFDKWFLENARIPVCKPKPVEKPSAPSHFDASQGAPHFDPSQGPSRYNPSQTTPEVCISSAE